MDRLYTVYNNHTDQPLIVDGTAEECAEAMKIKLNSFYVARWKHENGETGRWVIIDSNKSRNITPDHTVGSKIRYHRISQGLTSRQLARLSGISSPAICNIEHGRAEPTLFTACCIADALHVSLDYLTGRTEENNWRK